MPTARARRILAPGTLAFAAACLLSLARPLAAQNEPIVTITPGSGGYVLPTAAVEASVSLPTQAEVNASSRTLFLNGVNVTGQFTQSAVTQTGLMGTWKVTYWGTPTLQAGANTFLVQVVQPIPSSSAKDTVRYTATYTYTPGTPAVRVSPDGGFATGATSGSQHVFRVANPGTRQGTYALRAECRDASTGAALSGCSASSATVTMNAGDSATVTVSAPAGAAGSARVVRLTAEASGMPGVMDGGWVDVTVVGSGTAAASAPAVALVDLNQGELSVRGECVTVAVAPGAAYECGDLRIVHPLPAHRTYNRTWAPTLTFNSRHALPRPTVHADVTIPAGAPLPDSVRVVVAVDGVNHAASFAGSQFTAGVPRRVGVQWNAVGTGTARVEYLLQVTSHYASASYPSVWRSGTLAVIDRSSAPYGAGWGIGGVEELHPTGAGFLWVGGDGSTRHYESAGLMVGGGVFLAMSPFGQPDTLKLTFPGGVASYARPLRGGGTVEFDADLRHVRTVNRLGQTTEFVWNAGKTRVDSIIAPSPAGQGVRRWVFTYGPFLTQVRASAPGTANRLVSLAHGHGDVRVTGFTDPDGHGVVLTYASSPARRVTSIRDRRSVTHAFTYDAAWKLASARLWMSTSATANDPIQTFQAGESRGVAQDQGAGTSVAVADAYTLLDGPRTDVADHTRIWLTARGAPARVRDALGGETVLTRGDIRFPALVTRLRGPNPRGDSLIVLRSAGFDARGRVIADTVHDPFGPGTTAVTTYGWNDTINQPAWIKAPGVDTVRIGYDAATRNPLWQQQGGSQRRVVFHYHASGQVRSIHYPHPASGYPVPGTRDSLQYDALGNLSQTVSPLGFVTLMYRDALGRVVETRSPVHAGSSSDSASVANTGMRTTHVFDVMDRDTLTTTYGRAMSHARVSTLALVTSTPAETLVVRTTYDAGGLPLAVRRWAMPDSAGIGVILTTFGYDNAGRQVTETHGSDGTVTNTFDAAGNVVQQLTPMGEYLTMEYDALGRLTRRIVPSVMFTPETIDCADLEWTDCTFQYPTFPNGPLGIYTVPADTARFWHDAAGNMVRAENGDAIVSRTYHRGGALATDTLRIRTWDRSQTERHVYGIQYGYDAAGRTSSLKHPQNLTSSAQYDRFRYDPVTGAVDTVVSRTGLRFSFQQDLLGRVVRDSFPGGVNTYTYDAEGRRITRTGAWVDSLAYDARGKVVRATLYGSDNYYNFYSGIGNLVATEWKGYSSGQDLEEFRVDALGNVFWTRKVSPSHSGNYPEYRHVYEPGQSRVSMIYNRVPPSTYVDTLAFTRDTTTRVYDDAGNVSRGSKRSWRSDYRKIQTRSYFGPDGRLRAEQGFEEIAPTWYMMHERRGYFNEYRYDALGRRILVRTRRDGLCRTVQSTVDCTGGITRYVWSGDNILWEMRGPGADSVPAARLNEVSATAAEFGIVGYTHAGGVDRPLLVWKGATVVVPHTNWRGVFGKGTNSSGGTSTVAIEWPGFISTAYHAIMSNPTPTTNWMGSLIDGHRDPGGRMYMRNRYYDPAIGQFTQTDPIGLGGGMNTYGFAAGDPVNGHDPFGTECRPISAEKLRCTDVVPGDFTTIKNFLGGAAGGAAYEDFEAAGWTANPGCERGGFNPEQCTALVEAISHLSLHQQPVCRNLGIRASRRLGRGLYRLVPESASGFNVAPFSRRVSLGDGIFDSEYPGTVATVVSHEEGHVKYWFSFLFRSSRYHNDPGIWNHPERWDFVWQIGNTCR